MSDNSDKRDIRFIDSTYRELFRIPDGGYITITHADGEQGVIPCKYIDPYHFYLDGDCLHICQFAELMERKGSSYAPELEPETVGGYRITRRIPVGNKVFVMAHNPQAVQPYVTWQGYADKSLGYDWGHYYSTRSDAWGDLLRRADAERTGRPYDYTQPAKTAREHRERGESR
jgi:hypothetical protein